MIIISKQKFYSLNNILNTNADYMIIYGERSNGKTTAVLRYILEEYINSGYIKQGAVFRRWEEDFKGKNGVQLCENLINLGWVKELTKNKFNSILYYSQKWYLVKYDNEGKKILQDEKPFLFAFALTSEEHYKSSAYPNIENILFDEFITRGYYLPDEFIKFQNLLSTIIRLKSSVKIFMCGNTINKFCPYFNEMGLTGIKKQMQGTIDIYTYGNSELKVAVEYSDMPSKKKESNKYFAFNNPKLEMIKSGAWELDIYPHLPTKYKPKDIVYKFYLLFDDEILQGDIVSIDNSVFIYFHRKTTPIKEDNEQLVYQQQQDYRINYRKNILKPYMKVDKYIKYLFDIKHVFYQDNEVGEIVNNYIKWCKVND